MAKSTSLSMMSVVFTIRAAVVRRWGRSPAAVIPSMASVSACFSVPAPGAVLHSTSSCAMMVRMLSPLPCARRPALPAPALMSAVLIPGPQHNRWAIVRAALSRAGLSALLGRRRRWSPQRTWTRGGLVVLLNHPARKAQQAIVAGKGCVL